MVKQCWYSVHLNALTVHLFVQKAIVIYDGGILETEHVLTKPSHCRTPACYCRIHKHTDMSSGLKVIKSCQNPCTPLQSVMPNAALTLDIWGQRTILAPFLKTRWNPLMTFVLVSFASAQVNSKIPPVFYGGSDINLSYLVSNDHIIFFTQLLQIDLKRKIRSMELNSGDFSLFSAHKKYRNLSHCFPGRCWCSKEHNSSAASSLEMSFHK